MTLVPTTNDGADLVRPLIQAVSIGAHELLARVAEYHPADHPAILNLARTEARYQQARRTELYGFILLQDVRAVLGARLTAAQIYALEDVGPLIETPYSHHEGEHAGHILVGGI